LLSARATLQRLQAIEERMGRIRRERWGSREIDLDLLIYGQRVVAETGLQVPHPLLEDRAFALVPLAEIAPDAVHPGRSLTVRELLDRLPPEQLATVQRYRPIRRPLPEPEGEEDLGGGDRSVLDPRR
jgi:2-amino-4-hydroxy-6-hydroxymethyldihydropteridine diphosphokinase